MSYDEWARSVCEIDFYLKHTGQTVDKTKPQDFTLNGRSVD